MFENSVWYPDYYRTTDDDHFIFLHFIKDFLFQHRLRYMVYFRYAQNTKNPLLKFFCEYKLFRLCRKYGIEIKTSTKIGKGFSMIHPYNITVSPYATIGNYVTMLKGSTIGLNSGGNHSGAPIIGNRVYIGINSTIIGGIAIGDDVLIAPNTMVNCNVPSNSIVIGNPCIIIPADNPTKNYIWNCI